MKAKCINDKSEEYPNFRDKSSQNKVTGITKDKLYKVEQSKQYDDYFEVINDLGIKESYKKERFEVMEDKIIKVRCIDNSIAPKDLTLNKIYSVVGEIGKNYLIVDNTEMVIQYPKNKLEKVEDVPVEPTHTPIYAEEQLEQVKEKNKNFLNLLQIDIDNLKEDNKKLENTRDALVKANNELKEENENLIKEKELLERQLENELSRNHVVMGKNEELKAENERLNNIDSDFCQLYVQSGDLEKENEELKAEINQLRDKVQQSEFEIKKYTASEIGYKKIIIGLVEALKELTKNVCTEGLEE